MNLVLHYNEKTGEYEFYFVLRNTSEEYRTNPERHNIKEEGVGIIEMIGLAVLPKRVAAAMDWMKEVIEEYLRLNLRDVERWVNAKIAEETDDKKREEKEKHKLFLRNAISRVEGLQQNQTKGDIIQEALTAELFDVFAGFIRDNSPIKENEQERLKRLFSHLVGSRALSLISTYEGTWHFRTNEEMWDQKAVAEISKMMGIEAKNALVRINGVVYRSRPYSEQEGKSPAGTEITVTPLVELASFKVRNKSRKPLCVGDDEDRSVGGSSGPHEFFNEDVDHRFLKRGCNIGNGHTSIFFSVVMPFLCIERHCRF